MTFELLSPSIQKKIWDMEWRQFTPIQEAAIPVILKKRHCLLMAGTASGKTEAAFLPILSALEAQGKSEGLKVLYLSPLRALINDQFARVERLSDTLNIPLLKWHSDVSRSKKIGWLNSPSGILQITPESLESLLINETEKVPELFSAVEYIILDELHAFLESDRGLQVRSLLHRLRRYMRQQPVMIGLSATIGSPEIAQSFLHAEQPDEVEVLNPADGKRQIFLQADFFAKASAALPQALVEDIYGLTKDKKTILFCNSRGQVEELTHRLNETGQKLGGPLYAKRYYPHHSSIDRAEREWIEEQMRITKLPLTVVSTNTLELGIDIGSLDLVVQLDATFSVASLKQRLGRSGRREGTPSYLMMYATEEEDLVQAVAVTELLFDRWIEPPEPRRAAYDLLFHQTLSLVAERQGIFQDDLLDEVLSNPTFAELAEDRAGELITWMLQEDWLALVEGVCIPGLKGEKLLRSREFYSVFQSPALYKVMHGTRLVGTIEASPLVLAGETILLAGAMWEITLVEAGRGLVTVVPALQGKRPIWLSSGRQIHPQIAEKIYQVYTGAEDYEYLSPRAWHRLQEVRMLAKGQGFERGVRVLQEGARSLTLFDFAGTRRQSALATLVRGWLREQELSWQVKQTPFSIQIEGGEIPKGTAKKLVTFLLDVLVRKAEAKYMMMGRAAEPDGNPITKFGSYLPLHFQRLIEAEIKRDIEGLRLWVQEQKWKAVR